jgi:hypothetical protein
LHRILERFAALGGLSAAGPDRPPLLAAAAEQALATLAAEGGIEPALAEWIRDRWSAGLLAAEATRPNGILAAWLALEEGAPAELVGVERSFRGLRVGPVALRGAIDRVDRVAGGALLVLDYKSGSAPRAKEIGAGLALQPLAYLAAVEAENPGMPVAAAFVVLRRADEVRRTGFVGDPAAIEACCDPSERRSALLLDAADRRALMDRAAEAARRLVAGDFPTTLLGPDLAGCEHCPHGAICRVDHARNRRIAEAP